MAQQVYPRLSLVFVLLAVAVMGVKAQDPIRPSVPQQGQVMQGRFDFQGREVEMVVPDTAAAPGARALLVILHGGLGNAGHVRASLQMDPMAAKYGFLIGYLNGYPTRFDARMKTWNAGGCCGLAQRLDVDDVGYITAAIQAIGQRYGVRPDRIYGMGHSNGAMMVQRVMCQTGVFRAAVAVAGALEWATPSCPAAQGRRILAIHGEADENVPIAGGHGNGLAGVPFRPQADSQRIFERSGASYRLWTVPGAAHMPESIRAAIARSGGSMEEDVVRFLGMGDAGR